MKPRAVVVDRDVTIDLPNRRRYGEYLRADRITTTDAVTAAGAVLEAGGRELEPPADAP